MDRRKSIKALALGAMAPGFVIGHAPGTDGPGENVWFKSEWDKWPDMDWSGPEYWGNRLQDWSVKDGRAVAGVSAPNRTLHVLTMQKRDGPATFETSVEITFLNTEVNGDYAGFRLGGKGRYDEDYRAAAARGKGLDIGLSSKGSLSVGDKVLPNALPKPLKSARLRVRASPSGNDYAVEVEVISPEGGEAVLSHRLKIPAKKLTGNFALVAHCKKDPAREDKPYAAFSDWQIKGDRLWKDKKQTFGPVCFAQYTLHEKKLKLTAQLAPVEKIKGHKVAFQVRANGAWKTLDSQVIKHPGRAVNFVVEDWQHAIKVPYRLALQLPLREETRSFFYEGTIAAEPKGSRHIKAAVFSCNGDYGFPDSEVLRHVLKHTPDMAFFLGDQFYESTGGFGIQTAPFEKSCLDYLRKWMMFGWSYREIFRHIPCAIIPDDHDMYHGNIWGEGGKAAPTDEGWGAVAQDQGGYKMPPEWVNMVQFSQTSHLPDPVDPEPVRQGIRVYYTQWKYGGISFAILEDRKFKSAPQNVLPKEADILNSFVQNPDFDLSEYSDIDADLLGDRQLQFLEDWTRDWSGGIEMKAVLSQTNFCTVGTLPEGSTSGAIIPRLEIPEKGNYVEGDAPTEDMDSNGWPKKGRDEAVRHIRKCFAFHIAGDQHLASMVKYGVDRFGDSGYAFAGPPLNNIWPRRWWPPRKGREHTLAKPAYTGNFHDGFGNKMTVLAVANPHQSHVAPSIIHDRSTGYGIITFDKDKRTIKTECWPRYADPEKDPGGQFNGWPVTVGQQDNYGRTAEAWLPEIKVKGIKKPVIEIIEENTGQLVYALRMNGNRFNPKVFGKGKYMVVVSDPDGGKRMEKKGIKATGKGHKKALYFGFSK